MALPVPYPSGGLIEGQTGVSWQRNLWTPGSFDYDVFEDNFWGDQLLAIYPAAFLSTGTVVFTEHNANGFLEIKSGSSTGNSAGQGLGLQATGDRGVLFEAVITLPGTITNWKFEIGLTDSDQDDGAVNDKASPSHNATDYAVFILDTSENTEFDFMSDGASIAAQETTNTLTLAASDVLRVAIQVDGNNLRAWVNHTLVAQHSAAIEGGNTLTPWVFSQARAGAERILQLNKWRITTPAY